MILLLVSSALLAGSETALFSVARDRAALKNEERRMGGSSFILRLLLQPNRLLMTILLGNLFVNMAFFASSSVLIFRMQEMGYHGVEVVLSLVFLFAVIICGEILPKTIASISPYSFSRAVSPILFVLTRVLVPMTYTLEGIIKGVNRLLGIDKNPDAAVDEEHLKQLVDVSEDRGVLHDINADIMEKLIVLKQVYLKEVCVPRVDVKSCSLGTSVEKVVEQVSDWGFGALPLFESHHDDVTHYINIIDTLGCDMKGNTAIRALAKPIPYLSELSRMDYVLREFLENEWPIALVVDEFGDMTGIVTWNGVMGELSHVMENVEYHRITGQSKVKLNGRESIRDLGFEEEAKENESVTIGGFITEMLDRVPNVNEEVTYKSYKFIITKADEKGIDELWMIRDSEEEQS